LAPLVFRHAWQLEQGDAGIYVAPVVVETPYPMPVDGQWLGLVFS